MPRRLILITLSVFLLGAAAQAQDLPTPEPRFNIIYEAREELEALRGTAWEFITFEDIAGYVEHERKVVIFTDKIAHREGGPTYLATMYPECAPPGGPDGPIYELCGSTFFVQLDWEQRELFFNLLEYGYGSMLFGNDGMSYTWYFFNEEYNGLDEPYLIEGYARDYVRGVLAEPMLLLGRRIFDEEDLPPEEELPEDE